MNSKCLKIVFLVNLLAVLVGCTNTNGDVLIQEGANSNDYQEMEEMPYGVTKYVPVVEVEEIFEEDGKLMARLEPLNPNAPPTRPFFLETPRFVVLKDDNEVENVWPPEPFVDQSILWFEIESGSIEIEEDDTSIVSSGMIDDIEVGDVLRLYLRTTFRYIGGGMGTGRNAIDKIVIVR